MSLATGHQKPVKSLWEEGWQNGLNVRLGDSVTFMGDTQAFSAKVSSLRKVDWKACGLTFSSFFLPERWTGNHKAG
ncbi:sugar ABC transporter permease [Salmonella bongori]|nr:sugar ABC transporter permease [Salmonella bongori]